MFLAHVKYVKISNLNTVPNISSEQAKICFADYKMVPLKSITDYISDLIIKEILIDTLPKPLLVYKIYLYSDHKNNNEVGYIDAHTSKVVVNRKKKYSDFGKMKCSKFGNKSAVFSGTILQ